MLFPLFWLTFTEHRVADQCSLILIEIYYIDFILADFITIFEK